MVFRILGLLLAATILSTPVSAGQKNAWRYDSKKDDFSDQSYSYAIGYTGRYQYNDDFSVSFICKKGRVRFDIDVDHLIASKGDLFKFTFRVDDKSPHTLTMKTFSNDGEGGYSYEHADLVAREILGGRELKVRAITWNNDYLETTLTLNHSDKSIRRVYADCKKDLTGTAKIIGTDQYSIDDFVKDFKKKTPKEQEEILGKLKQML
ncbi:MAG: hypothetical protein RH946_03760 [Rhodospirillales bacterium]